MVGRPTRRLALQRLAGGAAAVGSLVVGACARTGPTAAQTVTRVLFQLDVIGPPINASLVAMVQGFVDRHFNASHRGVRATWQPRGNAQAVVATILAGQPAPVVFSSCCTDFPVLQPFFEPLGPYLKRDNIPASRWAARRLSTYQPDGALLAVPSDAAGQTYIYRQDILDQLGIAYPQPDWTYLEAKSLWTRCTSDQGGVHRYGATLPFQPGGPSPGLALFHGFGGAYMDATHTHCLLTDPGSVACGEYAFPLLWGGVCTAGDGWPAPGLATGQVVFSQGADPSVLWAVQNLRGAKWDFIPYPRWPVRPATIAQVNFYGLNAFAPNKDLAWELFRFAAVDPEWTRYVMRLTLQPPGTLAQLSEWETVLRSAVPLLRQKALHYWTQPAVAGDVYEAQQFFRHQPLTAITLVGATWSALWRRQLGVPAAFAAITRAVDAQQHADRGRAPQSAAQMLQQAGTERRRLARLFASG